MAEYLGKQRFATVLVMVLASAALAPAQQISDTPRPELWVTDQMVLDGGVYSIVESCGILYVGGIFSQIGPYTGSFVAIETSGAAVRGWPKVNGEIHAIAPDGAGGWYIGGAFTRVECAARIGLAHIRADRTVDPTWDPIVGGELDIYPEIRSLAVSGNTVYAGGTFNSIDGQPRNYIAALNSTTGIVEPWDPNADSWVSALAVSGNTVYAGGTFYYIGGQIRHTVAALDATSGAATAWNADAGSSNEVYALVLSDNIVYVGGGFTSMGGQTRVGIAALDATTGAATSWNPNANHQVRALAVSGSTVYAGGFFTSIGGQARNRIAAIDATTGAATAWNPNAGGTVPFVYSLAVSGSTVYAGGNFTSIGGQPRNYLAALDTTTGAATPWNPNPNQHVNTLGLSGDFIYAGGGFGSINGQSRNNLAALDATTGAPTAWNPNVTGVNGAVVKALAVSNDILYVGGFFDSIGGQPRSGLAALDATSGAVTAWNPNAGGGSGGIYAVVVSDNTVYVSGGFSGMGGQPRSRIAAVDALTGAATSWNPNAGGPFPEVNCMALLGNTLYVGGGFTSIGGQPRNGIAELDRTTGAATAWNPSAFWEGSPGYVYALDVLEETVYAGGIFTSIGGQDRNNMAALDATSGAATAWDPNLDSTVLSLAISGNTIFVGGYFNFISGKSHNYIAALDAGSGAATAWNPDANNWVSALAVSGSTLYAGGGFSSIGGEYRYGLAGFKITNSEWADAAGLWSLAANWNPPVVPNNTSCDQYNVRIAGASSLVTLDIDVTINTLQMEDNASLLITGGNLTIASPEGVASNAGIFVGPGHALIASTATNVCGANPIEMAGTDAAISSTAAENTIRLAAPVIGFGVIDAAFQNESTIDANTPGETIKIWGALSATSGGQMRASNGGTMQITRSLGGASAFVADSGGIIDIPGSTPVTVAGSTANLSNGGQWRMGGQAAAAFTGDVDIGCGSLRGCTPPVLECTDHSSTEIGGNLLLSGPVDAIVGSDTAFELAGDFVNECTSPATFHWETGPLTMDGPAPQTFELAGEDRGPVNAGFIDNFALGTLRVEPGRTVTFRDNFDNVPGPGCEVLYVNTLSLGADSTIILNGCNVYYRRLINEGATIDLQNGAALMRRSKEVSLADPR